MATNIVPAPNPLPVLVSIGEPAGIGPEIALNVWCKRAELAPPTFALVGDREHLDRLSGMMDMPVRLHVCDTPDELRTAVMPANFDRALPILQTKNRLSAMPSKPVAGDAAGVVEAIQTAVQWIKDGHSRALVTLPINKKSLYDSGFDYPGHTEFLGALAAGWPGQTHEPRPVMMLAGPSLKAVPVTIHIPLSHVPKALTTDAIVSTIEITARDLTLRFGINSPRIAVSGLNPHAGENGAMGHEDAAIIAPAIEQARIQGIDCVGPLPADTMFHDRARAGYDAAVCMYHDQALIPAKALAFDDSVNVTLGLPFVRTSPDHGTAYDIAGTGQANPSSFLAALRMADDMSTGIAG